jgi:two-component system sensor histidine kinase UhpB
MVGAIDASWSGVIVIDDTQRIVYANRGAARMFGYRAASLLGKPLDVLFPDDATVDHGRLVREFGRGRAKSRAMAAFRAVTCRHKDGTSFVGGVAISKYQDDGRTYFMAHLHDVSDREREREAREQTERRFETLVRHVPDVIMTVDADSTIRYINRTPPQYTVESVLGTRAVEFVDPESARSSLEAITEALASGKVQSVDLSTPEPELTYWNVRLVPTAPPNTPGCVLVIASDVTRYREAAEAATRSGKRFRQLVESIDEVYWLWEPVSGKDLYISPSFEAVWGRTLAEAYEDPDLWLESVHPADREAMRASTASARQGLPYEDEYRLHRPNGTIRWVRERAFPVHGGARDALLMASVIEDITVRAHAREELEASRARLHHLSHHLLDAREAERVAIARELHDDLGQTLTILKLDLAALAASIGPADTPTRQRIDAMAGRLDGAADASRTFAARLRSPVLDELGLEAAVHWELNQLAARTGLAVGVDCDVEGLTLEAGLSTALYRILQEALTNVIRHAQASRVDVLCERIDDGLRVMIRDDGLGADPERIAAVTSIGLTGMRERAAIVGGRFSIESEPTRGTTVTVWVPVTGTAERDAQAKPRT